MMKLLLSLGPILSFNLMGGGGTHLKGQYGYVRKSRPSFHASGSSSNSQLHYVLQFWRLTFLKFMIFNQNLTIFFELSPFFARISALQFKICKQFQLFSPYFCQKICSLDPKVWLFVPNTLPKSKSSGPSPGHVANSSS